MLSKRVLFLGESVVLACDGRCDKAWGRNSRPRRPRSDVFIGDGEFTVAPISGITEGGHGRPSNSPMGPRDADRMNKWCARECERCRMLDLEADEPLVEGMLPDLKKPQAPRPSVQTRREKAEAQITAIVERMTPEQVAAIDSSLAVRIAALLDGEQRDCFQELYAGYSKRMADRRDGRTE